MRNDGRHDNNPAGHMKAATEKVRNAGRRINWNQMFACLKYPNFRLWFWGQMISLFGSWMQITAQAFLLYQITRSPVYLGLLGFANGVPTWLFMLYAGAVADRVSRRKLLIITQTAMMILAFILAILTFTKLVQPWHILVLAVGMGIANAFDAPARQAFVLEMIELEDLTNAIALNGAMFNMATAAGPAVAGVTYALFGPGWCFVINGFSFIAVIAALAAMRLKPLVVPVKTGSIMRDIREGIDYVRSHETIRILIATIGVISVFSLSFATLTPAWAVKILGGNSTTNGLLQSARGAGALLGALLIASLAGSSFKGKLLTAGLFAYPGLLIVFAFIRWIPASLAVLFGVGIAQIFIFNLCNSLVQTQVQDRLRGRVMGIYSLVFFGMLPIGSLWIGAAASRFGETEAILFGSVITILFAAALWIFVPKLRALD
jgi:predicted MFS family arabinose efflux permease